MKDHTRRLTAFVAGAMLAVSGLAFGQGNMRDTSGIPGDTRDQNTSQGGTQGTGQWHSKDSVQGGTIDTMFGRTGRGIGTPVDSARHGAQSGVSNSRDSVQGSTGVAPDNTGINKRDRNSNEMTADEQGQSAADIDMTRKIRQSIMADDSLSTYAKNIKIITRDGMVTLKGPVRSDAEKSAIEAKAIEVAGSSKVKTQIEVKAASNSDNK